MRVTQEPEVRTEKNGEISSHPAFGQIATSRVSGLMNLYGSDFVHHNFIAIRITGSQLRRDISHDWHHATEEHIEVYLSESQWATFVSSIGQGCGVCCTITAKNGKSVPELPPPKSRVEQFSKEIDERLASVVSSLEDMSSQIDDAKMPKAKAEKLKDKLHRVITELTCNLDFVAKSFGEHAEATVEKAKAEVHGYMNGALRELIQDRQSMPKLISFHDEKEDS